MKLPFDGRPVALAGARLLGDGAAFALVLLAVPGISGPAEPVRLAGALLVFALLSGVLRPLAPYLTLPVLLVLLPFTLAAFHTGLLLLGAALANLAGVPVHVEGLRAALLGGVVLAAILPFQMSLMLTLRWRGWPPLPGRTRWKLWRLRRLRARLERKLASGGVTASAEADAWRKAAR